jgi:hypothetical protein
MIVSAIKGFGLVFFIAFMVNIGLKTINNIQNASHTATYANVAMR